MNNELGMISSGQFWQFNSQALTSKADFQITPDKLRAAH